MLNNGSVFAKEMRAAAIDLCTKIVFVFKFSECNHSDACCMGTNNLHTAFVHLRFGARN
jgi:hypothetical protein